MKENIKIALTELINLTETKWLFFSESLTKKHYKKEEYFIEEEEFCNYVVFIDKGFFNFF